MICPPELSIAMHADGALQAHEAAQLELHLRDCAQCRARLAALVGEAQMLRVALAYDPATAVVREFVPPPSTMRVAIVAGSLLLGAALLSTLRGLFSPSLPEALGWFNPLDAGGVVKLVIRAGAFLIGDGGAMIAASLLGTALTGIAVIALVGVVVALRGRIRGPFVMLSLVCVLVLQAMPSHALELRHNDNGSVLVAADETVDDTLIAVGDTIEVNGNVTGDVIAFARRVVIRGDVGGVVIAGGETVTLDGAIDGTVIAGAETLDVSARRIGHNLFGAGETVTVRDGANIEQNAVVGGEKVSLAGHIGRDVFAGAAEIEVASTIGHSLTAYTQRMTLLAAARIAGDVHARGLEKKDHVVVSPGAVIGGELVIELAQPRVETNRYLTWQFYAWQLLWMVAAFIVGLVLLAAVPALRRVPFDETADALRSSALGMIALVATPIIALLVCATVVGIPLGVIALLLWGIGIYLAKVIVAQVVGTHVVETLGERREHFAVRLAVGLFIVTLATSLPFIGGVFTFLVTIVGLGLLVLFIRDAMQEPAYDE